MKLLKSQKDTLFDLIESVGLSPSQFEFSEIASSANGGDIATNLCFKNSEYFFKFESGPGQPTKHYSIFCPGESIHTENQFPGDWNNQLCYVNQWLENLVREINTPNKWDRLNNEISGITINFSSDEGKFSVNEYEDLKQRILSLKNGIGDIGLMPDQINAINSKLDYLTDLAKEMNKFDWKSLFIGTIISIIIQLNVTHDNAKSLWTLIKQLFNNLLLP